MTTRVPDHRWDISPVEAIKIQRKLAARVSFAPPKESIRLAAGGDVAFLRDGRHCAAGVVVWDIAARCVVESQSAVAAVAFPYVPGLLSFREAPALLAAIAKLQCRPDAFLFDGQGYAHPRRFGLACHLGVLLNAPSVGCAKSRLIGRHSDPAFRRGSRRLLRDRGEIIGSVLRTRNGAKPMHVSVGHRMNLEAVIRLVLRCGNGYRLPEPTRLADQWVARMKRTA